MHRMPTPSAKMRKWVIFEILSLENYDFGQNGPFRPFLGKVALLNAHL